MVYIYRDRADCRVHCKSRVALNRSFLVIVPWGCGLEIWSWKRRVRSFILPLSLAGSFVICSILPSASCSLKFIRISRLWLSAPTAATLAFSCSVTYSFLYNSSVWKLFFSLKNKTKQDVYIFFKFSLISVKLCKSWNLFTLTSDFV